MKFSLPVLFALGTALCWGLYGPTLGTAGKLAAPQVPGDPKVYTGFKPYLGIGLAYLVIAIAGAAVAMVLSGDNFSFTGDQWPAIKWGFLAGCLGAFGALCLTGGLVFAQGNTHLVMPIVFAGAVSINAGVSALLNKDAHVNPMLWVGVVGVVVSVVVVAMNIPHAAPKKTAAPVETPTTTNV